jgi:hypothetical protein
VAPATNRKASPGRPSSSRTRAGLTQAQVDDAADRAARSCSASRSSRQRAEGWTTTPAREDSPRTPPLSKCLAAQWKAVARIGDVRPVGLGSRAAAG